MQKGAFSCTGLADDGNQFACKDFEMKISKEGEGTAGGAVGLFEPDDLDQGGSGHPRLWFSGGPGSVTGSH